MCFTISAQLRCFRFWGAACFGLALLMFSGCHPSSRSVLAQDPPAHDDASDAGIAERSPVEESRATSWEEDRYVRLRAEAWPTTEGEFPWRVLEDGGAFVSDASSFRPWRVILLSREPSAWAGGVLITLPASLPSSSMPTRVQVFSSPTPREITRASWPSVSRVLIDEGEARVAVAPGQSLALTFAEPIRVSILVLVVHESAGNSVLGLGRVQLIRDVAALGDPHDVAVVPLAPAASQQAPVDAGALEGMSR